MTANSMQLQERQVVNIADGKCLGNLKDIELNLWTGSVQALVLPGMSGFWNRMQKAGELRIPWDKVVRIGVDVILVNMPELAESDGLFHKGRRKSAMQEDDGADGWQEEVNAYREELEKNRDRIIVLEPEDYREV